VLLSWSSGKDSAWCLHVLRHQREVEVAGLITTVHEATHRVAAHGVREHLLEHQAAACGLPLIKVPIPDPCPNESYEQALGAALHEAKAQGVTAVCFGDLYLADIREYRERVCAGWGIEPLFPIWQQDTRELARAMVASGLRAHLTCVDLSRMPRAFVGRVFDEKLLRDLPDGVDPCGENGEFHTFVYAGPIFEQPIAVRPGTISERDGFAWANLVAEADSAEAQSA
jgi:uncharacterized protein (TIGR00290 family)